MNELSQLGGRRLIEQIEQRRPVLEVFRDLLPNAFDSSGAPTFSGAVSMALRLLDNAKRNRVSFRSANKGAAAVIGAPTSQTAIDLNRATAQRDYFAIVGTLTAIAAALDSVASKNMDMLNNRRAPDHPAGRREKQAMTSEPIKVEVITMPARVTDVRVERNAAGDIVSTSHLEQDLPKKSDA